MSALADQLASRAMACAADVCWRQWRSLAAAGLSIGGRPVASVIDPEALVLLSLSVRQHERRLDDQLLWWAGAGSWLMSVQRTRTLLGDFSARVRAELAWFAALAVAGGDPRWKVLVDGGAKSGGRLGKGPRELQFLDASTLMLRLRAGLGVGAKADMLAFLIGAASRSGDQAVAATVEVIAKAISYSVASTRRAANEMVVARLVRASEERPAVYSADAAAWARVLRLHDAWQVAEAGGRGWSERAEVPPWRFWAQMFALLAACVELGEDARFAQAAPVVQASRLRDVAERFRRPLGWNGIEWLDPRMFPGERYAEAFDRMLTAVVGWIGEKA